MSSSPTNIQDALASLLTSRFSSAKATLRKLSALAVVRGITGRDARIDFSENEIEDCRAFVYLADAVRPELPTDATPNALYEIFDGVAEAFERFPAILDRETERSRQLRSALNYVGAVKVASAYIVTPSDTEELSSDIRPESLTSFLQEAISGLLRHEYRALQQKYSGARLRSRAMTILNNPDPLSSAKAAIAVAVGKSVSSYAGYSIDNSPQALEMAQKEIRDASRLCGDTGDLSASSAVAEIRYLIDRFPNTYSRSVLQPWESQLGEGYLSLLTRGRDPIHQLWPSQIEAVKKGLLKERNAVVSMPTSAGKTLLAELKIAASLNRNPTGCVFYVVPLNALARQIQKQLQQRLRQQPLAYNVKVLTGAYEIEDADLAAIKREKRGHHDAGETGCPSSSLPRG